MSHNYDKLIISLQQLDDCIEWSLENLTPGSWTYYKMYAFAAFYFDIEDEGAVFLKLRFNV